MRYIIFVSTLILAISLPLQAQYTVNCPYLQNPETTIGYVDSCAQFWMGAYDSTYGGFYTNIDRYGNLLSAWGTNKNTLSQTRDVYGFVRAYMMTGNELYLDFAESGLEFLCDNAWDDNYGGWFSELNMYGNPINTSADKTAFDQHYALLGIAAYYEATNDTTAWDYLMRGFEHLQNAFWDNRPDYFGYYDRTNYSGTAAWDKSFNATVDAITTHLLYLYLLTEEYAYKSQLLDLAQNIIDHLAGSMPGQAIGFVEHFDSDWNWDNSQIMTLMGHVLKAGWCLGRIYQIEHDSVYISAAEDLVLDVWDNGYDHDFGGPYKDYDRVTGQLLLWGLQDSTKAWWQMEQAITAGLELFEITGDSLYLQMADESLDFFMTHFVDREYSEVYADRTRYGGFAWNEAKGSSGKAGYHSIETGYYTYLYGNLFYHHDPVILHYNFIHSPADRSILLTPLAIEDSKLRIASVTHEGQAYTNFDPEDRVLTLPAGIGGHFEVTFEPVYEIGVEEFTAVNLPRTIELYPAYPNPFNPTTVISYQLPVVSYVNLAVYDIAGKRVIELVNGWRDAGMHEVTFDASDLASGVYIYRLNAERFSASGKIVLMK
jgi:mannose/cellobiose epimerase-like protein (N-acyl-D-glucosamine 2-epimerase family)